jgi:hypothetical protein
MSALLQLAERCEKATGPDNVLEREIAEALGWRHVRNKGPDSEWFPYVWVAPDGECDPDEAYPDYTESLDAAMQLVPEGCSWNLHKHSCWARSCVFVDDGRDAGHCCDCATPALALVAAALRARAAS